MNDILAIVVYIVLCILGAEYQVALITAGLFRVAFALSDITRVLVVLVRQASQIQEALTSIGIILGNTIKTQ